MSETETMEPRVSTLELDEKTRSRMAEELGLVGGADALPTEVRIIAVDPKDAMDEEEVQGFSTLGTSLRTNNIFMNMRITPRLSADALHRYGVVSPNAFNITMVW